MKLQVKNASVSLNGNTILEEVNFEINNGEHIALVGRNGAGKTTLLRALENNDMFDEGVGEEKFQINKMGTFNIGYMKQVDFEDESITLLEEIQKPFKNLIDMEKKLSKKALSKSFHNWYYGHLTCFSQEHMQTFGYLCSMLPLVEDLYSNEDDKAKAMNTYTAFFNTEPQLGTVIVGITVGLEEARANGVDDVDDETINGLRAGLMGPIAGIGDSLVVGTVIPILLGIAMGMSTGGSPLGAIFYIIVWNLFAYFGMKFLYYKGYSLGTKAVEFLIGAQGDAIRESVSILGGMVIGAVSATWVSVTTSLQLVNEAGEPYLVLQDKLNEVFPGLLTAVFVIACWFLMAKKQMSPIKVMLLLVVVAFIGVLVGFFNPGLVY